MSSLWVHYCHWLFFLLCTDFNVCTKMTEGVKQIWFSKSNPHLFFFFDLFTSQFYLLSRKPWLQVVEKIILNPNNHWYAIQHHHNIPSAGRTGQGELRWYMNTNGASYLLQTHKHQHTHRHTDEYYIHLDPGSYTYALSKKLSGQKEFKFTFHHGNECSRLVNLHSVNNRSWKCVCVCVCPRTTPTLPFVKLI